MDELFKSAPEIIRAAATSPLALAALVVLTLGVLAYIHFRNASEFARAAVYVLTGFAFLILFGLVLINALIRDEFDSATIDPSPPLPVPVLRPVQQDIAPVPDIRPAGNQFASACVTGSLTCPLIIPAQLQKGASCACYTIFGEVFEGIAQ